MIKVALNGSKPLPLRRGFGTCYHQNLHCSAAGSSNVGCQNAAVLHIQGSAVVQVLVNVSAPRNSAKRGRRGYVKILTISGEEGLKRDKREAGPRRRRTGDRQAVRRSAASRKSTKVQDVSLVLIRARWGLRSLMRSQCGLLKYFGNFRRAFFDTVITQPRRNIDGPGKEGKTA